MPAVRNCEELVKQVESNSELMLPGGFLNALALVASPVLYLIRAAPLLRRRPGQ